MKKILNITKKYLQFFGVVLCFVGNCECAEAISSFASDDTLTSVSDMTVLSEFTTISALVDTFFVLDLRLCIGKDMILVDTSRVG